MRIKEKTRLFCSILNMEIFMHDCKDGIPTKGRLIIHADDFGLTEKVNKGIMKAHQEGILTSASIMASGAAFEHAVEICRIVPTLDIGVHLTLVEERPVLGGNTVKTLINKQGRFHEHARQFVQRYFCGLISLDEVRLELDAQIQKVLNTGIAISHLDSHQHLHMLPGILSIVVELANKYHVPAIRFPREKFHFAMLKEVRLFPRIVQLLILRVFCYLGRNMDAARTDCYYGFFFGGNLNKRNFLLLLETLPQNGTGEIMCHPGLDEPGTAYGHWRYNWLDELKALLDSEITAILQQKGVDLISYRELVED